MRRVQLLALLALAGMGISHPSRAAEGANATPTAQARQRTATRNVALLLFDGVQIIDDAGLYETFGHAYTHEGPAFNIYTVSETGRPVTTAMGMTVIPTYRFDDAPQPSVLLVPGGSVQAQMNDAIAIGWIQVQAKRADIVMSVCNGALILAKTGLLDGRQATTRANLVPLLRRMAPRTTVVDDQRYERKTSPFRPAQEPSSTFTRR